MIKKTERKVICLTKPEKNKSYMNESGQRVYEPLNKSAEEIYPEANTPKIAFPKQPNNIPKNFKSLENEINQEFVSLQNEIYRENKKKLYRYRNEKTSEPLKNRNNYQLSYSVIAPNNYSGYFGKKEEQYVVFELDNKRQIAGLEDFRLNIRGEIKEKFFLQGMEVEFTKCPLTENVTIEYEYEIRKMEGVKVYAPDGSSKLLEFNKFIDYIKGIKTFSSNDINFDVIEKNTNRSLLNDKDFYKTEIENLKRHFSDLCEVQELYEIQEAEKEEMMPKNCEKPLVKTLISFWLRVSVSFIILYIVLWFLTRNLGIFSFNTFDNTVVNDIFNIIFDAFNGIAEM